MGGRVAGTILTSARTYGAPLFCASRLCRFVSTWRALFSLTGLSNFAAAQIKFRNGDLDFLNRFLRDLEKFLSGGVGRFVNSWKWLKCALSPVCVYWAYWARDSTDDQFGRRTLTMRFQVQNLSIPAEYNHRQSSFYELYLNQPDNYIIFPIPRCSDNFSWRWNDLITNCFYHLTNCHKASGLGFLYPNHECPLFRQSSVPIAQLSDSPTFWLPNILTGQHSDSPMFWQPNVLTAQYSNSPRFWQPIISKSPTFWQPNILKAQNF